MKMRHYIYLLLTLLVSFTTEAQTYVTAVRSDLTPPTPQSETIMEVQSPEPDLITGAVRLTVPIYNVAIDNVQLPISLVYHSNGIKVFDDPAPLGYGWSLMPALRATRTVKGRPDEHYPYYSNPNSYSDPTGMCYMCSVNPTAYSIDYKERYDNEHDLFTIGLPGKNVTYVLDNTDGQMRFIGSGTEEYQIEAPSDLSSIKVRDQFGTQYIYSGTTEGYYEDGGKYVPTAWGLTKIITDTGREINISWSKVTRPARKWTGGYSFTDHWVMTHWNGTGIEQEDFVSDKYFEGIFSLTHETSQFIQPDKISFPGGTVTFSYTPTTNFGPMLHNVTVNSNKEKVSEFNLKYKGNEFTLLEQIDGGEGRKYVFDYNTDYGLNPFTTWKGRHAQDWWGYYNDKDNESLTPKFSVMTKPYEENTTDGYYSEEKGYADRTVDGLAMQAMILKQVTWPTGGSTEFEYEPHRFSPQKIESNGQINPAYDPELSVGGGLRVKTITTTSGDSGDEIKVNYEYPEAKVRSVPSLASFIEIYNTIIPMPYTDGTVVPTTMMRTVNIMPVSDYTRYDIGSTPLWYDKVTAVYEEGKTETCFEDVIGMTDVPTTLYGRRYPRNMSHVFDGSPVMTRQTVYRQNGSNYEPVQTKEYKYKVTTQGNPILDYHITRDKVFAEADNNSCPDMVDGRLILTTPKFEQRVVVEDAYSVTVYQIDRKYVRLMSVSTTEHTETGDLTTKEDYTYKQHTGLPTSVTTETSEGNQKKTEVEYADASNGGTEAQMVTANVVGIPLRETISEGSAVTRIEAEYIKTVSGAFRQHKTKVSRGDSFEITESPRCDYDAYGNIIKVTDADGISTTWEWDDLHLYPTLKNTGGLKTGYEYKPLVGVSRITEPFGAVTHYDYDAMNRLKTTEVAGLGKIQEIFYNFVTDNNYISVSTHLDATRTHTATEHYDNLGRKTLLEDNTTGLSQHYIYDGMGRCYGVSVASQDAPTSEYDYSTMQFERSPRGVAVSSLRNGEEWHQGGHYVRFRTLANTETGLLSCPRYEIGGNGQVTQKGHYGSGQLIVEESTDENGHVTRKYTTKTGLVVMTEEGDGTSGMLRTRNIYDGYGRLRFILSPGFEDGNFVTSDDSFIKNCHEFEYDGQGRLETSRTPGSISRNRKVYSAAGRVVAEHTSAMTESYWLVNFYDSRGRLAYTAKSGLVDFELESLRKTFSIAEFTGGAENAGYRLSPQPDAPVDDAFSANYYDDYGFLSLSGATTLPKVGGSRPGLQTGAYDTSSGYTVLEYDAWGRVTTTHTQTPKGVMTTEVTLDRSGLPLTEKTSLGGMTISQTNTYDQAGRITNWETGFNGNIASGKLSYGSLGKVTKETFGNSVGRTYDYDCHGWLTEITTSVPKKSFNPKTDTAGDGGISETFYRQAFMSVPMPGLTPFPGITTTEDYTEKVLYTTGQHPRYDGTASGHVSTLGGRYDYVYDSHDRLTKAIYDNGGGGAGFGQINKEDFSTEYSYNDTGAPTTVVRKGVNGISPLNAEQFGVVDSLSYDWDGVLLNRVTAKASGKDFYGRTGYQLSSGGGEGEYTWNNAGLLNSDSARGITNIVYNWRGQPQRVTFEDGGYLTYVYLSDGTLRKVSTFALLSGSNTPKRVSERTYIGGFVFEGDSLEYVHFGGGYFDGTGKPHYRHADWQGNITMVTDCDGKVEQHTGYYPYGEPWREPSGQRWLYGGKERMGDNGLNEYDFSARRLNSALCLWMTPDPLAAQYGNMNPYVYCAGNPIKFVDPSGCIVEDPHGLKDDLVNNLKELKKAASILNIEGADKLIKFCNSQLKQIDELEKSQNTYVLGFTEESFGYISIDANTGNILIYIPSAATNEAQIPFTAHEMQHGYQFEIGKLSICPEGSNNLPTLYDITDEIEAYNVQSVIENGISFFTQPKEESKREYKTFDGGKHKPCYQWTEEDVLKLGGVYTRLPRESRELNSSEDPQIKILKERGEYYNIYRFLVK